MIKPLIYVCIPTIPGRGKETSRCIASILENTDWPYCLVVYKNQDGGWNPAIRNMLSGIDGYVELIGCDVTVTPGWLSTLATAFFEAFPEGDGMAQPWDDYNKGLLAQHPLAHSRTFKKFMHPGYVHNYTDTELTFHMKRINKYLVVKDSIIIHHHWRNGRANMDNGYKTILSSHPKDKALFLSRQRQGFPL